MGRAGRVRGSKKRHRSPSLKRDATKARCGKDLDNAKTWRPDDLMRRTPPRERLGRAEPFWHIEQADAAE
jgi:hypothetical protein